MAIDVSYPLPHCDENFHNNEPSYSIHLFESSTSKKYCFLIKLVMYMVVVDVGRFYLLILDLVRVLVSYVSMT